MARVTALSIVCVIVLLSLAASPRFPSHLPFQTYYLGPTLVAVLCYRSLGVADSPEQAGGYIPSQVLGLPRTRRLLFLLVVLYGTQVPLAVASFVFSSGKGGWRPAAMQASQASLLMIAISVTSTALFLQSRYRAVGERRPHWKATLSTVIILAVLEAVGSGSITCSSCQLSP